MRTVLGFLTVLLPFVLSCTSQIQEDEVIRQTLVYDSTSGLALDVCFKNPKDSLPVLVYIHGGGWWEGDKSEWCNENARYLLDQGIMSVSINYTLAPDTCQRVYTPDGIYPTNTDDVIRSIEWVRKNIAKYGGDPDNIFIMGFSAGTYLASLVVTNNKLPNMERYVKGVINLDAGPYLVQNRWLMEYAGLDSLWMNAFGTKRFHNDELNPAYLLTKRKWLPPFFLVCNDIPIRENPNKSFNYAMTKNNHTSQLVLLSGVNHRDMPFFAKDTLPFTGELITFVKTHTVYD